MKVNIGGYITEVTKEELSSYLGLYSNINYYIIDDFPGLPKRKEELKDDKETGVEIWEKYGKTIK